MTEIDQVAVMGEYMFRCNTNPLQIGFEVGNALIGQRFCHPLALVFCEQRKGPGTNLLRIEWCIFNTTGCTNMGSNKFHINSPTPMNGASLADCVTFSSADWSRAGNRLRKFLFIRLIWRPILLKRALARRSRDASCRKSSGYHSLYTDQSGR